MLNAVSRSAFSLTPPPPLCRDHYLPQSSQSPSPLSSVTLVYSILDPYCTKCLLTPFHTCNTVAPADLSANRNRPVQLYPAYRPLPHSIRRQHRPDSLRALLRRLRRSRFHRPAQPSFHAPIRRHPRVRKRTMQYWRRFPCRS